jgi:uncharacterized protein YqfB (UPF0267 family)
MPKSKVFYTLDAKSLKKDFGIESAKGLTFEEFMTREAKKEGLTAEKLAKVLKESLKKSK